MSGLALLIARYSALITSPEEPPVAEYADREHYIPLRVSDLVGLLCGDKGLARPDAEAFRQFCRLVSATFHFEYHQKLSDLKDEYAPFDPDSVTRDLRTLTPEEREGR